MLRYVRYSVLSANAVVVQEFWSLMRVPHQFLDLFVKVDLWWDGSVLLVNAALRDEPSGLEQIKLCLSAWWRWVNWSDTRWFRCGVAGKYYLRSQACGADAAVRMVLADGWCGHYSISGYQKADKPLRKMLAVGTFCSLPIEFCHER